MLNVLDKRYRSNSVKSSSFFSQKPSLSNAKDYKESSKPFWKSAANNSKNLTIADINDKKAKGLYFHCDEKYSPGHNCNKKQLYVMLTEGQPDKDESCENEELALIWEEEHKTDANLEEKETTISLHAISGSNGSHTLKIQDKIKNMDINILVDSGSTNSFVSQGLVKQIKLTTSPCSPFKVVVANGERIILRNQWILYGGRWKVSHSRPKLVLYH